MSHSNMCLSRGFGPEGTPIAVEHATAAAWWHSADCSPDLGARLNLGEGDSLFTNVRVKDRRCTRSSHARGTARPTHPPSDGALPDLAGPQGICARLPSIEIPGAWPNPDASGRSTVAARAWKPVIGGGGGRDLDGVPVGRVRRTPGRSAGPDIFARPRNAGRRMVRGSITRPDLLRRREHDLVPPGRLGLWLIELVETEVRAAAGP